MTAAEKTALENDKRELMEMLNPRYFRVFERPKKDGYALCLRIEVNNIRTWVVTPTNATPHLSTHITIYVDVPNGYPKNKVQIYYGPDMWPAHVNVFSSHNHAQCIDAWTKYSSLASSVRKTLHAVVFDPAVVKFNSMANSSFKPWMEQNRSRFPSFDPSLLFRSSVRRPGVHV